MTNPDDALREPIVFHYPKPRPVFDHLCGDEWGYTTFLPHVVNCPGCLEWMHA